jgi:hypothetical protein
LVNTRRSHLEFPLSVTIGYLVEKPSAPISERRGRRNMKMIWTKLELARMGVYIIVWWLLCLLPNYLRSAELIYRFGKE